MLPKLALVYLPVLLNVQADVWPGGIDTSFIASQIEQETCYSLTHSKCWNPTAELKTSREYGFGLGQITRAYTESGSLRFDKFSELTAAHASLRDWTWENRFDPRYQLTAIVEMNRGIHRRIQDAASPLDAVAFLMSAYNGGEGGLKQDRLLCRNTPGCDPSTWFGNVERTSLKSKVKWQGYGKSAYEINREYVVNVIHVRRPKYETYLEHQR